MHTFTLPLEGAIAPSTPTYLRIATHRRLDADEGFAIWLIRSFAEWSEKVLPGSSTAEVMDFTENELPPGTKEEDYPSILFVGCGKGRFDEHQGNNPDECAATKVAKFIGIDKFPASFASDLPADTLARSQRLIAGSGL